MGICIICVSCILFLVVRSLAHVLAVATGAAVVAVVILYMELAIRMRAMLMHVEWNNTGKHAYL